MIPDDVQSTILELCDADRIDGMDTVQSLWSGYGEIARVHLSGASAKSLIVKWVNPPDEANHPRGWSTDQSHQRKLRSYQVESHWYQNFSERLNVLWGDGCRVAKCYHAGSQGDRHLFLLEDLDAAGFGDRHGYLDSSGVRLVLTWLARFHATFLGRVPDGLWPVGTYWHLATRPDELAVMHDDEPLKQLATSIDLALSNCPIQSIVHGDAKVANFCFARDSEQVAAVDFQYVGGGCGMKDVAYFLGSCLDEDQCDRDGQTHLDFYFAELDRTLNSKPDQNVTGSQVEAAWRPLYPIAWADFHRFLIGWCPGHQKLHGYTRRMTEEAIKLLQQA